MYMGKLLDSPNDLVQSSSGNIYFSNPTYELGGRPVGVGGAIFRRDPQGMLTLIKQSAARQRRRALTQGRPSVRRQRRPLGSRRQRRSLQQPRFSAQRRRPSRRLRRQRLPLRRLHPRPAGAEIAKFSGGTNLAFGGPDGKTLLIVGGGTGVKTLQMNLPGLP